MLALYHHDPSHDDAAVDSIVSRASDVSAHLGGPLVIGASEGLVLEPGRPSGTRA
jgi:hypothetical protein